MRTHSSLARHTVPTRPRNHAQLILGAGNEVTRNELLSRVPAAWLALVQEHIACAEQHYERYRQPREKLRPPAPSPLPVLAAYQKPEYRTCNPHIANQHLAGMRAALNLPSSHP